MTTTEYERLEGEAWLSTVEIEVARVDFAHVEALASARFGEFNERVALSIIRHVCTPYDALAREAPSAVAVSILHRRVNAAIVEAYPELRWT